MVALGEGGQALDVHSEEAAEGISLCLAELGELGRDVLDGAVPLAQLDTDGAVLADGTGAGSVALGAKGVDESPDTVLGVVARGLDLAADPLLEGPDAVVGEGADRAVASPLPEEAHRVRGETVVVGPEVVVTGVSDDPLTRGTPTAALALVRGAAGDRTHVGELVEVSAHARGGEAEVVGDLRGADGPALADHREDAVTRARIASGDVDIRRRLVSHGINHTSMLRNYGRGTTKASLTSKPTPSCLD